MGVAPYKGNVYDIPFGQSGMKAHENRWLAQRTELLVANNVTFENDVLQKDPAVTVYDPQGIDAFSQTCAATSTVSGNWQACMGVLNLTSLSTTPTVVNQSTATSQASPWTITVGATVPVGTLLLVSFYQPGVQATVSDSKGNTYSLVSSGHAGGSAPADPSGLDVYLWAGVITTQLTNATDTITLTWTGGTTNPQLVSAYYGSTGQVFDNATASATGTACTIPAASPAPMVALRSYIYPLLTVDTIFLNKDTATATVTAGIFTKIGTANSSGVGQLIQAYKISQGPPAISAQFDWNSQAATGNVAGTVAITQGVTTVTGTGTSFTTAFRTNDEIIINNEVQVVQSITSNTVLATYAPWQQATASGQTASRRAGPCIITAALQPDALGPGSGAIYKESNGSFFPGGGILAGTNVFQDTVWSRVGKFVVAGKESSAQSRKLFWFDGLHTPQFLADDGVSFNPIPTPPVDWGSGNNPSKNPINGILHQGALFGWGNLSDPHRIYRSTSADHTKFVNATATDDAGQYPIASSIGERLWGGAEYQGVLFLWKYPRGIFYFDDTDPNFLNWSYHIVSEALGCAPSPYAVLPIDGDVLFMAPDGHIHLLSAVASLGGTRTSDVTRMLGLHRWTRENIDIPSLKQMTSAYNPYTKTAYLGVRSRAAALGGTPDNDMLLKLDFSHVSMLSAEQYQLASISAPVRFSYSTAYKPNALCIRRSASQGSPQAGTPLLMIGEIMTSMLQVLDDGTTGTKLTHGFRTDPVREFFVSTSYAINATTPRLDFSDVDPMNRQRRKNWDWVEFVFGESAIADLSNQTLTAQFFVDGNLRQTMTIGNITNARVAKPLRCGNGYELQIVLTTTPVVSAPAALPTLTPDIVGLGIQVYWRPSAMDHSRPS